jgi:hypothetical protein
MTGKNRIMIFGPKDDGIYVLVPDGCGRPACDLDPPDRGGGDPALPGADALRAVRAGCGRMTAAFCNAVIGGVPGLVEPTSVMVEGVSPSTPGSSPREFAE